MKSKAYFSASSLVFPVDQELSCDAKMFRVVLDFAFFGENQEVSDYVSASQHVRYFPVEEAEEARNYVEYVCHHVAEEISCLQSMRDIILNMNSGNPLDVLWDDWKANAEFSEKADAAIGYPIIKAVSGGLILDLGQKAREELSAAYDATQRFFEAEKIVVGDDEDFELDLCSSREEDKAIVSLDFLRGIYLSTCFSDGKTFSQFMEELLNSEMRQYL